MNYYQSRLKYLLAQSAFRENPVLLTLRSAFWLLYCLLGHSPRFRLIDQVWFRVPPVLRQSGSSSAFVLRHWAEPELHYLDQMLPKGGGFIDCGANIGIYTVRGAGIVGTEGKVISVEPGGASFEGLRTNIELNRFSQVILVNKAISESKGTARLYHADGGPVSFSLVPKLNTKFEEVKTTTIDRLVEESCMKRVDCIKLDVEGVEVLALRGARQTLSSLKPTVIFELTSPGARRQGAYPDVPGFLRDFGYSFYRFAGNARTEVGYESPNIVAVHPERRNKPSILKPWSPGDQVSLIHS